MSTDVEVLTDTGWKPAGSTSLGSIQVRLVTGVLKANIGTYSGSSPGPGYDTRASISGPNRFGLYSVLVTANPDLTSFSRKPPGYKTYAYFTDGKKRQHSQDAEGVRQTRLVSVRRYYAGNENETTVKDYVEGAAKDREGVEISPNGRGEYFQGRSFKITDDPLPAWEDDDATA
jgi:hypothetical protein